MTNEELILKARGAKSPEELLRIAQESGMTGFTEENARTYFDVLSQTGEMSDEELNVSAGSCAYRAHGQKMVSSINSCSHWTCDKCNNSSYVYQDRKDTYLPEKQLIKECFGHNVPFPCSCNVNACTNCRRVCDACYYCSFERSAWWCNNDEHFFE